ncbi:MAG: VWA domain-containing protein [Candidatus Saganbacteria bacterium]|nr:VWA domain-containing protein [Candidatus Saganbacteria bacterium]
MKKNFLFLLTGIVLLSATVITGCNNTININLAPGMVTSPEAVVSGAATVSGGTVTLNLGSIIVSGEALSGLTAANFKIYVGTGTDVTKYTEVTPTVTSTTTSKIDMVFILDRTGSMGRTITGCKNSIVAFASTLDAAGADVKFGVVAFGDTPSEQMNIALPASSTQVQTFLATVTASGGGDGPENPLDSIMYAYNNYTWRAGAQKVFIVLTDACAHQKGDGPDYTTRTLAGVQTSLSGNAVVYTVSPTEDSNAYPSPGYDTGTADIRWLADGCGWTPTITTATYGTVKGRDAAGTTYVGTGGKWMGLPSSGNVDLTALGISTSVTKGYTVTFSYTVGTTLYIHVLIDKNKDGIWDIDGLLTLTVSTSGKPEGAVVDPSKRWRPGHN